MSEETILPDEADLKTDLGKISAQRTVWNLTENQFLPLLNSSTLLKEVKEAAQVLKQICFGTGILKSFKMTINLNSCEF